MGNIAHLSKQYPYQLTDNLWYQIQNILNDNIVKNILLYKIFNFITCLTQYAMDITHVINF